MERARHSEVVGLLSRSKPYVQLEVMRDPSNDFPEVFDSENEPEHFVAARSSTVRSSVSNRSDTGSVASAPWKKYIQTLYSFYFLFIFSYIILCTNFSLAITARSTTIRRGRRH